MSQPQRLRVGGEVLGKGDWGEREVEERGFDEFLEAGVGAKAVEVRIEGEQHRDRRIEGDRALKAVDGLAGEGSFLVFGQERQKTSDRAGEIVVCRPFGQFGATSRPSGDGWPKTGGEAGKKARSGSKEPGPGGGAARAWWREGRVRRRGEVRARGPPRGRTTTRRGRSRRTQEGSSVASGPCGVGA